MVVVSNNRAFDEKGWGFGADLEWSKLVAEKRELKASKKKLTLKTSHVGFVFFRLKGKQNGTEHVTGSI